MSPAEDVPRELKKSNEVVPENVPLEMPSLHGKRLSHNSMCSVCLIKFKLNFVFTLRVMILSFHFSVFWAS